MRAALLNSVLVIAVLFSLSGLAQRGAPVRLGWVEPTPLDPSIQRSASASNSKGLITSMHDAILAGLVTRPDPERRRLVVAITGGVDNRSITSAQSLEGVARRTEAVLHVIVVQPPARDRPIDRFPDGTRPTDGTLRAWIEARPPGSPSDFLEQALTEIGSLVRHQPPTRQETALFETVPALTGGAFHGPGRWRRNVNAVDRIRDVIAEFRQSYVIQYTPRDVAPGGWHEVVVRVKRVDPGGVRTRAGYFDTAR